MEICKIVTYNMLSRVIVEMLDIQIQTDEQIEIGNNQESDLIRLQSSMSMLQEDFNRERKMLNDQIAKLQAQVQANEKLKENMDQEVPQGNSAAPALPAPTPQQPQTPPSPKIETKTETSITDRLEAPDKPLPMPPTTDLPISPEPGNNPERDATHEKEENIINEAEQTQIQASEQGPSFDDNFETDFSNIPNPEPIPPAIPKPEVPKPAERRKSSSSSSSSSSSDGEKAQTSNSPTTSTSQKTVREANVAENSSSSESDKDDIPVKVTDNSKLFDTKNDLFAQLASETVPIEAPDSPVLIPSSPSSDNEEKLSKLKSIIKQSSENLERLQFDQETPEANAENSPPAQLPLSSSSDSSSDEEKSDVDKTWVFNGTPIEVKEEAAEPEQETPGSPIINTSTSVDIFDGSEKTEEFQDKPTEANATDDLMTDSQIHQMLDFFNKKYADNTTTTPPPTPTDGAPVSTTLVDIDITGNVEEPKPKAETDTAAMEVQWGVSSSSETDDEDQKTQISNQAEKPLETGNSINIDMSTDDEVGLTELDTDADNDGVSILPDASQSTFADHEDRDAFLNSVEPDAVQVQNGNLVEPPRPPSPDVTAQDVAEASNKVNWGISSSEDESEKMEQSGAQLDDLITSDDEPPGGHTVTNESTFNRVESPKLEEMTPTTPGPDSTPFSFETLNIDLSENISKSPESLPKSPKKMAPIVRNRSGSSSSSSSGSFSSGSKGD